MAEQQLTAEEIAQVRALRTDHLMTFEQIGDALGVDTSTAHRILSKPGYEFTELLLLRIRRGLARVREENAPVAAGTRKRA